MNALAQTSGGTAPASYRRKGYSQEEGKPVRVIQERDVEKVPPDVKHRHGAAPDSWLVHISITPNAQKGDADWLEPVTDDEYKH